MVYGIHAYIGSDWVGNVDDHKITSGGVFYLGPRLVSWFSKKQSSITLCIVEVEYLDLASCCTQILWMIQIFHIFKSLVLNLYVLSVTTPVPKYL